MEPLFVCEYTPTVKSAAEQINQHGATRRWIFLLMGVGVFLYSLVSFVGYTWLYGFELHMFLLFLFGVVYGIYGIFMPWISGYFYVRRFKKNVPGGVRITSFGEKIEIRQGGTTVWWDYCQVSRVIHLNHSYELIKGKNKTVILDPERFTKGTFAEFKQFLRQKRPDLLIPE